MSLYDDNRHINIARKSCKKGLKIPKVESESVYRRRIDNTMAKFRKNLITENKIVTVA